MKLTRRRALQGALGLGVAAAALEVASLRGHFDNRRPMWGSDAERFLAAAANATSGLVHLAHSTHLLCLGGVRVLTDPWFFDPAFGALTHSVRPPCAPEQLRDLDLIAISHDHPDHADLRALDRMPKEVPVLCATAALAAKLRALGFSTTHVLAEWEQLELGALRITATPAEHDTYEVGYVFEADGISMYFAGDTRLCPAIDAIAERFSALDLAVLPVDGTKIKTSQLWVMTPQDAVVATTKLAPKLVIPSHAEAHFSDPLVRHALADEIPGAAQIFTRLLAERLPNMPCRVPEPGEHVALR